MTMRMVLAFLALGAVLQQVRGTLDELKPPDPSVAPGLRVELRTRDGQPSFHLYEPIPLEVRMSSSVLGKYTIDVARGMNAAAGDTDFTVSPGDSLVWFRALMGIVCCDSRRQFLTSTPHVFHHYLTANVRFQRPGTYQVRFQSREIFRANGASKDIYHSKGDVTAISNVLTLTILPDDPAWDEGALRSALAILDDPEMRRAAEADTTQRYETFKRSTRARLAPPSG